MILNIKTASTGLSLCLEHGIVNRSLFRGLAHGIVNIFSCNFSLNHIFCEIEFVTWS